MRGILVEAVELFTGRGRRVDFAGARRLFLKAAETDDPLARMCVAWCHSKGRAAFPILSERAQKLAGAVIEDVKSLARTGDPLAVFLLGTAFHEGVGVEKDHTKAMELYRKAEELGRLSKGHADELSRRLAVPVSSFALLQLGWMYESGHGVARDYGQAVKYYRRGIECGNALGFASLGLMYHNGRGVPKDYQQAMKWYRKGMAAGGPNSMYNLSWMYRYGQSVAKDPEKAMDLYLEAADAGSSAAMNDIGHMYQEGEGVPKDYAKAVEWYRKAIRAGNTTAMVNMGQLYRLGVGVDGDFRKALELYRDAADAGNTWGMYHLLKIYKDGVGTPGDRRQLLEWYRKSAVEGDAHSIASIGWMYEQGIGTEKDYKKAAEWYENGVELDSATAMNNLGWLYEGGLGVPNDYDKAFRLYTQASEKGDFRAPYNLGRCYEEGLGVAKNDERAAQCYRKAADEYHHKEAMFSLAKMYQEGRGVPQDDGEAARWFSKAAKWRHAEAAFNAGWRGQHGLGFQKSGQALIQEYGMGASNGHVLCMHNLALLYERGELVALNYERALLLYRKAVRRENTRSMNNLGRMYLNGLGVPKDYKMALELFSKAAQGDEPSAVSNIGLMYEMGWSVEKDRKKALEWYSKASKLEDSFAKIAVRRIDRAEPIEMAEADKVGVQAPPYRPDGAPLPPEEVKDLNLVVARMKDPIREGVEWIIYEKKFVARSDDGVLRNFEEFLFVRQMDEIKVNNLAFSTNSVWAATDKGAYCYERTSGGWVEYAVNKEHIGLPVDSISVANDHIITFKMKVNEAEKVYALDTKTSQWE